MEINLGRYYTSENIGHFLVSQMNSTEVKNILDLGCGVKCLSHAASNRWNKAEVITLDIDDEIPPNEFLIQNNKHVISDALFFNLPDTLGIQEGAVDIAVCNPPFVKPNWREEYRSIVTSIGIDRYFSIKSCYNSEILFLAQIIRMLKSGGEAGVILPDGIFSAKRFKSMREYLISEHNIKKVIELPSKIFSKTEAKTHILVFNKEKNTDTPHKIELRKLHSSGRLSQPIFINEKDGIHRLDYSFHELKLDYSGSEIKLGAITEIRRGRLNSKEIRELDLPTIHITNIKKHDKKFNLCGGKELLSLTDNRLVIAGPGDILISRVGRNFHEKMVIVNEGYAIVSDCLFLIKCKPEYRNQIFSSLTSKMGQKYLIALSYGVAAKQISMEILKEMKIRIIKNE